MQALLLQKIANVSPMDDRLGRSYVFGLLTNSLFYGDCCSRDTIAILFLVTVEEFII